MKALTWSTFVCVVTEARRPDRGTSSAISRPFIKYLCHRNTSSRDIESLPNAFWIYSYASVAPSPSLTQNFDCITLLKIILLHFCDAVTRTTTEPHVFMPANEGRGGM
jgi:hypothetical protein